LTGRAMSGRDSWRIRPAKVRINSAVRSRRARRFPKG
jgi:hypothetical protein